MAPIRTRREGDRHPRTYRRTYVVPRGVGRTAALHPERRHRHPPAVRQKSRLVLGLDADGPKAEATRRAFFDRVIAEKGMIAGYHFGFPNVGTLSKDGNGYAFAAVKA